MSIRSVAAAALLGGVALAAPAAAAVAPGRVTFPTAPSAGHVGNASLELSAGVALPGGGVVLAGRDGAGAIVLAQLRPDGSLDPAFGAAGIAHVVPPTSGPSTLARNLQVLRERDGRLLVVATATRSAANENDQLVVVGVSADGTLDATFGSGGVAAPGVQSSCLQCSPAALAPDGSIVLTGDTGQIPPGIAQHPGVVVDFHWVVARLTPTGRLDPRFGAQGIVTLPGTSGVGYASASLPGGAVAVLGATSEARSSRGLRLRARWTPSSTKGSRSGSRGPCSSGSACAVVGPAASTRSAADRRPRGSCATPPPANSTPTSARAAL